MKKNKNTSSDPKGFSTETTEHSEDTDKYTVVLPPNATAAKPLLQKKRAKTTPSGYTKKYVKELIMGGLLKELGELLDPLTNQGDTKDLRDLKATISSPTRIAQYRSAVLSLVTKERASKPALASEKIIDIAIEYFNCLMLMPNINLLCTPRPLSEEAIQILYSNRSFSVKLMLAFFYSSSPSERFDSVSHAIFDGLLTEEKLRTSFTQTKEIFLALEQYLKAKLSEDRAKELLTGCAALMQLTPVDSIITNLNTLKARFQSKSKQPISDAEAEMLPPLPIAIDAMIPAVRPPIFADLPLPISAPLAPIPELPFSSVSRRASQAASTPLETLAKKQLITHIERLNQSCKEKDRLIMALSQRLSHYERQSNQLPSSASIMFAPPQGPQSQPLPSEPEAPALVPTSAPTNLYLFHQPPVPPKLPLVPISQHLASDPDLSPSFIAMRPVAAQLVQHPGSLFSLPSPRSGLPSSSNSSSLPPPSSIP